MGVEECPAYVPEDVMPQETNAGKHTDVKILPAFVFSCCAAFTPAVVLPSVAPFSFCSRRGSCLGSGGGGFRSAVLRARLRC